MFTRIVGVLIGITKVVMVTAFVTMIALTLVQVLNRYALGLSIFWTEELIVLLLVWSMLLGLPVQLWAHEEIVVDVLPLPDGFWTRA
ncbi:MAG: TRAP transporter small permease subunit, partial [Microvirga sp.]